ncbi:hypothetical protein BGW42_002223 [Actinomortierella wolfii]|nr:hypothetical protein BGW42_002223 [Actinomortierella wolfii]
MTKKILVVFGASGNQGGSVVDTFLSHPHLSAKYHIRAVTRDANKPVAKALQAKGAEVIEGDVDDAASLPRVLQNADAIFLATVSIYDNQLRAREYRQAKAVIDAAIASGTVRQIVFSALPDATTISGGKYAPEAFESKLAIEKSIRALSASHGIRSAFYTPAVFTQNFHGWMTPRRSSKSTKDGDDNKTAVYEIQAPYGLSTQFPLTDAAADTGKWVAAMVEHPEKYDGQSLSAATRVYTLEEIVQTLSKVSGKTIVLKTISEDEYRTQHPPEAHDALYAMVQYLREFPYYGPDQDAKIRWAAEQARPYGELSTLEDYVVRNPLRLE